MDLNQLRLSIEADLAETHKLLTVATRPVVRESLVQLFTTLEQSKARLIYNVALHQSAGIGHSLPAGYAAAFSQAPNSGHGSMQAPDSQQAAASMLGQLSTPHGGMLSPHGVGLSPYDPIWSAPTQPHRTSSTGPSWSPGQQQPGSESLPNTLQQLSIQEVASGDLSALMCNAAAPVLPALRYGMNLQLANKPMPLQTEIPFRILSTCSWEQSPYTVKIYVPLHGVKTELLRATFETNSLEVKAVNLQGRNYKFTIKHTFRALSPDGCSVVASKTKKNILITIAKAGSQTQEEQHWHDLQRSTSP